MKKLIALLTAFTLLLVCSCAAQNKPETEETSAPEAIPATPTEAAVTETAYEFRLEELPDIGAYSPTEPKYYYGAPLNEFRESDGYGTIVPYMLKTLADDYYDLCRYGFMTGDGAIITAPVYDSIDLQSAGDESFYIAQRKALNLSPQHFDFGDVASGTDAEQEAWYEAYHAAQNDVKRNIVYQCVSTDGSRCFSSRGASIRLFTDETSGMSVVECKCIDGFEHPVSDDMLSFRLYDTQFRLLADFADLAVKYRDDLDVVGADPTGFVLEGSFWNEALEYKTAIVFTEGVRVTKTTVLDESVDKLSGDRILCYHKVYDREGSELLSLENDWDDLLTDPRSDTVYYTDLASHRLIRLDKNGQQTEYGGVKGERLRLCSGEADGRRCIVLEESKADWEDPCSSYTVFDESLRKLYRIDYEKGTEITLLQGNGMQTAQYFLVAGNGKTQLRGLTGKLLAEVPYIVKRICEYDDGSAILHAADGHIALFSFVDHSVKETDITAQEIDDWVSFYGGSILVLGSYGTNVDRHTLYNAATGQLILAGVDNFNCVKVNGKLYCAVAVGDEFRMYDGDLRLLLRMNDDINV